MASLTTADGTTWYGPNPGTERGEGTFLSSNKAGTKLVYCAGNVVIVRDVADPSVCEIYREHKSRTTVAKFSPSGNYIASGDASGKVRVWAYDHPEKILKKEIFAFCGEVFDLEWGPESKRLVVCGSNGSNTNTKAFLAMTGSSQGELSGMQKKALTCAMKPTRPYRAVSAGEAFKVYFYEGPPFKFKLSHKTHTNFVQCVRYAPSGEYFCSVSNDKKIVLYDGKEGNVVGSLPGEKEHKGSIYGVSWSADSKKIITCSSDKTVKLWDVESKACEATMHVSAKPTVQDMQVGCTYAGDQIISLSLSGDLNYLDPSSPSAPTRIVQAHASPVLAIATDLGAADGSLYSGGGGGDVVAWSESGAGVRLSGQGPHKSRALGVTVNGGKLHSVGWDDCLRSADVGSGSFEYSSCAALGVQPIGVSSCAADPELAVVASTSGIRLVRGGKVVCSVDGLKGYDVACVAMAPDVSEVAVGGSDNAVHLFSVSGDAISPNETGSYAGHMGKISALAYSPDGTFLAVGDTYKEVRLWDRASGETKVEDFWVYHQAKVTSLAWTPDSKFLASGSVDSHIYLWNPEKQMKKTKLAFAHTGGVNCLAWRDGETLYSGGVDFCIRRWNAPKLPM